jgi:hypothetical protein
MAEVSTQYNIIKSEVKFTNRKKKRRRMNILTKLFDARLKFTENKNFHEIVHKSNLFHSLSYIN